MINGNLSVALFCEEGGGEVAVAGIREECDNRLALVFRTLGEFLGGPESGARRNTNEYAFGLADFEAGFECGLEPVPPFFTKRIL